MNCPSRTDEPLESQGWNQSPPGLAADSTTRQDLNGMVNLRAERDSDSSNLGNRDEVEDNIDERHSIDQPPWSSRPSTLNGEERSGGAWALARSQQSFPMNSLSGDHPQSCRSQIMSVSQAVWRIIVKFGTFVGPGFMVSVAYIDPGNYSTDVAAGAATKFRLLFIVLMSNIFAILLQSLAVRLGTVTGLNLAEHCRTHLPPWLNFVLYLLGEAAIIATDIAEVTLLITWMVMLDACSVLTQWIGDWLSHRA